MDKLIKKGKRVVIGTWGYNEEQYCNNKIFVAQAAVAGEDTLLPMNDLFKIGRDNNVEFVSLDLIADHDEVDSYIFFDFPRMESRYVEAVFATEKPKYLFIFESSLIRPDNWNLENHKIFSKIFSYRDDIVDNKKYFKINYSLDMPNFVETVLKECAYIEEPVLSGAVVSVRGPVSISDASQADVPVCSPAAKGVWDKRKGLASIIVSAFGKLQYTKQCVDSILRYTKRPYELILFDNGSSDGTFEYYESIKKIHPDTVVVRNYKNRIVEENSNYLHSLARGEYIVGISNDIIVHEGWLDNFIRQVDAASDIGIVGPRANNISGPQFVKTEYRTIDEFHQFAEKWCRKHAGTSFETNRMVGMALIIRKETNERIGGFDPDLATNGRDGGYGFSDDDFSLRLRIAGYRLLVANDVFVHHFGSVTVKEHRPDIFGAPQNLNKAKFENKLMNNPRVKIGPGGELSILPYRPDESIPLPERMQISFPKICIAMISDDEHTAEKTEYNALMEIYPLGMRRIKRCDLMALLHEMSASGKNDILVLIDDRFSPSADQVGKLIAMSLCNPEVAVMAPLTAHAPSTHSLDIKSDHEVDLIHYADMSVCAVNVKRIKNCLMWAADDLDDAFWFLQRRIRGEGFFIARANNIKVKSDAPVQSHPYDDGILPEALLKRKDIRGAASIFKNDVRRDPMFIESIYQLGRIAFEENIYSEAIIDFSRVLELDPHHISSLIHLAKILLQAGDVQQAERAVSLAFLKQPGNPEVKKIIEQYELKKGFAQNKQPGNTPERRQVKKGLVSIVVTGVKHLDDLKSCVKNIRAYTPEPHEILFIDSGYSEKALKWLDQLVRENSHYIVVKCAESSGFAAACNRGIRESSGEYILLLNNMVEVSEGWMPRLLECLLSKPDMGIVGPVIAGDLYRPISSEMSLLGDKCRHRRTEVKGVDWPCMLFSRGLSDAIGLLDEELASNKYAADDYCLRARLEGYGNLIAGDVFVRYAGKPDASTEAKGKSTYYEKWSGIDADSALGKQLLAVKALEKADEFSQKGNTEKAIQVLIEGMQYAPGDARLYYFLLDILIETKQFKEALDVIERMPVDVNDARRLTLTGYCKAGMDLMDEADQYADKALARNESSAVALNLKGIVAFKREDRGKASDILEKAKKADPGFGEPYTNLGVIRWSDGNHIEGLDLLEKGFILSPMASDIVDAYYSAISQTGNFDRLEKILRETAYLYPLNRRINFLLIGSLMQQGKDSVAMLEIERAMITYGIDDGILSAALAVREKVGVKEIAASKKDANISLCMIVKNEEANLGKCLLSVESLVDEIIVIDTGSADRTRDIAKAFGAKVYDFEWTHDFSEARNVSLSKANGDWILVLDADEVISPRDFDALKKLVGRKKRENAYSITTRNYVDRANVEGWTRNDGGYILEEAGTGWLPSFKVRLFPNDEKIRFENPVHELVERSLIKAGKKILSCSVPIHHYGKLDSVKSLTKGESYYQLGRKKLDERGDEVMPLLELALQASELEKYEEARELLLRLLKLDPDFAKAHFNLGYIYLKLGNHAEGIESSLRALQIDPNIKEAVLNYSSCEVYGGNVNNAISALEEMLNKNPGHPPATALLGMAYIIAGKVENGIACIEQIKKMKADCPGVILNHAKEFERAGRIDFAVLLLETAVSHGYVNSGILSLLEELKKR